ncbi:acyl carrier protein [Actinoplanes sp. NPDC051411]|uniref:acyl carrier protein n=1 Tax=Actinoplanes sp. NPDC051411 TaxID=3155522 RepID=UPI00342A922B
MSDFTVVEFKQIVQSALGPEEAAAVGPDTLDTRLGELGIDSLGMLEIANQIQGRFAAKIPDDRLDASLTPRNTIQLVQSLLP